MNRSARIFWLVVVALLAASGAFALGAERRREAATSGAAS